MIGVRKLLDFVFTKPELKILDDILPEFKRHEKIKLEEQEEEEEAVRVSIIKMKFRDV